MIVYSDDRMHDIVDENDHDFIPVSNEHIVERQGYSWHQRFFKRLGGEVFLLRWKIIHGTPKTVRTIFEPMTRV